MKVSYNPKFINLIIQAIQGSLLLNVIRAGIGKKNLILFKGKRQLYIRAFAFIACLAAFSQAQ